MNEYSGVLPIACAVIVGYVIMRVNVYFDHLEGAISKDDAQGASGATGIVITIACAMIVLAVAALWRPT